MNVRLTAAIFPLFFVLLWLIAGSLLAAISGWFRLMTRYPDRIEAPLLRLRGQSGSMGPGVAMRRILRLSVCPSGLRIGVMRLFGPFCRDFFVPWSDIRVVRKKVWFWPAAKLCFGDPPVGSVTVAEHVANKMARAAAGRWPESGPVPEETRAGLRRRLLAQWAMMTVIAAAFFTLVPLLAAPARARPPVAIAILFPAIVFGVPTVIGYLRVNGD